MALQTWQIAVVYAWTALLGISVPFQVCNINFLNSRSDDPDLHGWYVSQMTVLLGGIWLAPPALLTKARWERPTRFWSLLGGLCSLPAFITISATPLLGAQLLLMVQICGMLGTFLLLDIASGTMHLSDWPKLLGFFLVLAGVTGNNWQAFVSTTEVDLSWFLHLVGVFASGVGYALQAKCNGRLAADIGGPARAAMIAALVNVVFSSPITFYIGFGAKVPVQVDPNYWYLLLVGGFQSAFFTVSMAQIPALIGFTSSYMVTLGAKLVTSTIIDAVGLSGIVRGVTWVRSVSLLLVLMGASIFNINSRKTTVQDDEPPLAKAFLDPSSDWIHVVLDDDSGCEARDKLQ